MINLLNFANKIIDFNFSAKKFGYFIIDMKNLLNLKVLATIPYLNFIFFHTWWYFWTLETPPMY